MARRGLRALSRDRPFVRRTAVVLPVPLRSSESPAGERPAARRHAETGEQAATERLRSQLVPAESL